MLPLCHPFLCSVEAWGGRGGACPPPCHCPLLCRCGGSCPSAALAEPGARRSHLSPRRDAFFASCSHLSPTGIPNPALALSLLYQRCCQAPGVQVMQDCGLGLQKSKKNVTRQDTNHTDFSLHIAM